MYRNKIDDAEYNRVAAKAGLSVSDVKSIVNSFFAIILGEARRLPFDTHKKIFSNDKFSEYAVIRNIPYLGRLGPVYSRYLKWRANEACIVPQVLRSSYRSRYSQSEIENMAAEILSGKTPSTIAKKKNSELYERVWLVGKDSKKSARQVIPKEK